MSRLRANQITNENANGAPNFPHGLTVTGIVTAATTNSTSNQIVVGSAVTANSQGIDVTGVVTATSFSFIDVTNTSNVKVHFYATCIASGSQVDAYNSGNGIQTSALFIRLGDT